MARVTKHNRDREDDDMDLDDRRQAKRARQASNKVDSTGGNGDMRSRRAEGPRETISSTSRQSSAFHAQALARNLPQMAVVDNPLHPTIKNLDMAFVSRIKEAVALGECTNCLSGETPHTLFDCPETPLCCKCGHRGHQGLQCNTFPDKSSYLHNHGLEREDEATAFRHASNPPYPDSIPRPYAGDKEPLTAVPTPETKPAEQTQIVPWKMIYKVKLKSHGILHRKYWEVTSPPFSGKYLSGERASNLIPPNLEHLQNLSRNSACQDWPEQLQHLHNPLALLEMMAKFDEALDNEVNIGWVYSQRSIGYREQLRELRDGLLETKAGRVLLDMRAKRGTDLDLRLQAEEKIWDMEKRVRRLESELQDAKNQLKEEHDKNQTK